MDISKKIKRLLVEKDLTATELAKRIGISQSYFSKKMNNNDWSVADIEKIVETLDVKFEITLTLEDGTKI